jgi:hypothetical protein
MCPIRSIYFATNLLPIEPLLSQPPRVFTALSLSGANAGAPGITNILTDFQIAVTPPVIIIILKYHIYLVGNIDGWTSLKA